MSNILYTRIEKLHALESLQANYANALRYVMLTIKISKSLFILRQHLDSWRKQQNFNMIFKNLISELKDICFGMLLHTKAIVMDSLTCISAPSISIDACVTPSSLRFKDLTTFIPTFSLILKQETC